MRNVYGDQFDSGVAQSGGGVIPEGLRKIAGAVVFLGLIGMMGLWSYRLGTRDAGEVPIIRAMSGPARVAPADPGGSQAAHQGLEVNSVLAGEPGPEPDGTVTTITPTPALAEEDAPQDELLLAVPPPPQDGESVEVRVPPLDIQSETDALVAELSAGRVGLAPFAEAPPNEDAAEPVVSGPRPRGRPAGLARARPVQAEPPAQVNAVAHTDTVADPVETVVAAAQSEIAEVRPGMRLVQLGAFDSAEITREAWARLVARHGDLLGAKSLYVERTTANARVFYRLRVAGFENPDETRAMCEALRARSVDCIPVTLQ